MSYYDKDELLKYFSKQIKEEAEKEISKLEKAIADTKKRQLTQIDNELKTAIFKSLNTRIDELESEHNATINKLKIENHKKIMRKRSELLDSVLLEVEQKLNKYVLTKAYSNDMKKKIEKVDQDFKKHKLVFKIRKNDDILKKIIEEKFSGKFEIEEDEHIMIGGFSAVCHELKLMTDETIDTKVDIKKQWLYEHAKLAVNV